MFGELTRWNPSQELSSWHRDIDDLFGRLFGRLKVLWVAGCRGLKHSAKIMSTLFD